MSLLLQAETEGVDEDEAVELAIWLVESGLVHSTGTYGRFVDDVIGGLR